jgi:sialate O-acetylesterase
VHAAAILFVDIERNILNISRSDKRSIQPISTAGARMLYKRENMHHCMTLCLFLMSFSYCFAADSMKVYLPPVFSDNMVLQAGTNAPIRGNAAPGMKVRITTSWGARAVTSADQRGTWKAVVRTPKPGGPYTMTITIGDSVLVIRNILIGEVWVASGQSNMEMPLSGWGGGDTIINSAAEIASASVPALRLFKIAPTYNGEPQETLQGKWIVCHPDEVGAFSAAGYFFGKRIHNTLKVPVGIIQATWGGTPVEAWMSIDCLEKDSSYRNIRELTALQKGQHALFLHWLLSHPRTPLPAGAAEDKLLGMSFGDEACRLPLYSDSLWSVMHLPQAWEHTEVGSFDGVMWFRKSIGLPAHWRGRAMEVQLGPIDDYDETFVNGKRIGWHTTGSPWQAVRSYGIDTTISKDSVLTFAIRVIDVTGGGGVYGADRQMYLQLKGTDERIPLAGDWRYRAVAEYRNGEYFRYDHLTDELALRPRLGLDIGPQSPAGLFNGMIAPLIPYAMRGVLWYQGESNTHNPQVYRRVFPLMIKDWRSRWSNEFPFYFVQIAPFQYSEVVQSAELREAQQAALSLKNTGMAVTLDIGSAQTIHPSDKKSVGERLALIALANTYKKKIAYSGPVVRSIQRTNDGLTIVFDHAEGLTVRPIDGASQIEVRRRNGEWTPAEYSVEKNSIRLKQPEIVGVRYAWSNTAQATIFNSHGLPASSFYREIPEDRR